MGPAMNDVEALKNLLKDQDCACPACGYNLRGLTGGACPECGKAVDVSAILNRGQRLDFTWLIMLMSFVAALPWSLCYTWQRLIIRGKIAYGSDWNPVTQTYGRSLLDRPFGEGLLMLSSATWWLSVPVVCLLLIVFRRRITRLPVVLRWALAIACVLMLVLAYRRWQWWYYALGINSSQYQYGPWWWLN